jgi:hypothetical protein
MRADYGFSTSEIAGVAAKAASEDLRELRYLLRQAPMSWRWLEQGCDVSNMLTVRRCLADLAGAAYAMQDAPAFRAATETLLRYSLAASRSHAATPTQLLLDVALGIALRQPEAAHQAAVLIQAAGGRDDLVQSMLLEAPARTLAHLALGDMSMADLSAQELTSACATERYSKHTTAYFSAWADAAAALAQGNGEQLHEALSCLDQAHHARLQAALVRSARGRPADWSAVDLWDWLTAALVTMALDRQLDATPSRRYSDAAWIDDAAMSK